MSRKFYGNLKSGLKQNRPFAAFHSRGTKPLVLQGGWGERKREENARRTMRRGKREERLWVRVRVRVRVRARVSIFRLLRSLLANPAGAYAEERIRILGG